MPKQRLKKLKVGRIKNFNTMKKIAILSSVALAMIIGYSFTNGNSNKLQKLDTSSTSKATSVKEKELIGSVVIIFVVDGSSATAWPGTTFPGDTYPGTIFAPQSGTETSQEAKLKNLVKNY